VVKTARRQGKTKTVALTFAREIEYEAEIRAAQREGRRGGLSRVLIVQFFRERRAV
jgi:hypothetical protein